MEGEMVGMAHYMEAEDAERLGSMPQEDFDALSLETQRLLILMLRAYEIRVLAEIDPDNARIIYGEGTHQ
jgi:hypothetical protein